MAILDVPRHEAEEVGRSERRVQARLFLDVLQGVFESAWERPEDLQRALAELPNTAEGKERRRVLSSYLEAISGCLREGSEAEECEMNAGAAAQGRRKRGHRARRWGRCRDSDQEDSGAEAGTDGETAALKVERARGAAAAVVGINAVESEGDEVDSGSLSSSVGKERRDDPLTLPRRSYLPVSRGRLSCRATAEGEERRRAALSGCLSEGSGEGGGEMGAGLRAPGEGLRGVRDNLAARFMSPGSRVLQSHAC